MLLSKINLLASLAFATTATAVGDVKMFTDDIDLLNSLGIRDLLDGWDDAGFVLNGITFHETPDDDGLANTTVTGMDARDLTLVPRARGLNLAARAPSASCGSPSCSVNPQYHFFTEAQEKFITGKMCQLVAKYGPPVGTALLALYATGAMCETQACNLLWTAAFTIGETATGLDAALADACQKSYDAIGQGCGDYGGADTCAVTSYSNVNVKYTARAVATGTGCPAGTKTCSHVTCDSANDNCQDY